MQFLIGRLRIKFSMSADGRMGPSHTSFGLLLIIARRYMMISEKGDRWNALDIFIIKPPDACCIDLWQWNGMDRTDCVREHLIHGLVQDCSNSSALAMKLLQSCTKPWICLMRKSCMCANLRIIPIITLLYMYKRLTSRALARIPFM